MAEVGTHVLLEHMRKVAHHHDRAHEHALAAGQATREPGPGAAAPAVKPTTPKAAPGE